MAIYKVEWVCEFDADTPEEAAEMALLLQRNPYSTALFFSVFDDLGNEHAVDLSRSAFARDLPTMEDGE